MTAVLEIQLFGGLQIRRDEQPVTGFVSSKVAALLAYLAVTGRTHQRDTLAALLWGEMAEADAKNNLRQALANLRKLVASHLLITRANVTFDTAVAHILDTAQFEALLQNSRVPSNQRFSHLAEAATLYQGDFLAGFYVRDAPDFEEWLLSQRVRFRELALHTLHILTEHHLSRGEYGRAIDSATRLLTLDNWREEAYRQLMLALARSGQRSAALAQYKTCRRLLDQELGVAPSAETTALFERIRAAGDKTLHNLPPQPTPFVGRSKELARIQSMLLNPECRLLTLSGASGMGKTRLALQVAERMVQQGLFLHGIFFVSLLGVDSATLLTTAVASACGLKFSGSQKPMAQLLTFLQGREMLLILDNFEHLLEESAWLSQLLRQVPGVKLLVTSRETLNIQWERNLPLDGLTLPPTQFADKTRIVEFSAIRLFLTRAQAVRPEFALTAEMIPDLTQICHVLEGMPLGLELAAAMIRQFNCAEITAAITHNLDVLTSIYRDMPSRHRSLRAVFETSWALLPTSEQQLFAALSVFLGSFSQEAAEKVATATRPLLAALVDKSLLARMENGRYQLHNFLRQYAAQQLKESHLQSLQQSHATYFGTWLHQREQKLFTPTEAETFQAIQADLDNVRAAWFWALSPVQLSLLTLGLNNLRTFYNVQGRYQEGAEWLEKTAAVLKPLAAPDNLPALMLYAKVLARWASFAARQGDNDQADALFKEALALARQIDDPGELGFVLLNKGYLTVISGDYETAGKEYQESLAHYRRTEDKYGIGDALSALGGWHNVKGNWEQAKNFLEESVVITRRIKNEHGLRSSLTNLGNVYYYSGDYRQAKIYYEEVLPLCQKVGDRAAEAIIQCNLGALAEKAGNFSEAEQRLQRGISLFTEANHPQAVVHASLMLVPVYREMKAFANAQQILTTALKQAVVKKYDYLIPIAIFEMGCLYQAQDRPLDALPLLLWTVDHPSAQAENRFTAQTMIEELLQPLTPVQVTAVKSQGAALDVTAVLAKLENESADSGVENDG